MHAEFVDFALLLETHNKADIAFIKSILSAYGIIHYILGEYSAPYLYYAIPLRVLVKKDQMAEARKLLNTSRLAYAHVGWDDPQDLPDEEE